MSFTVPVAFTEKFHDDFILLAQQQNSRLIGSVRTDPDFLSGKFGYFDRIGALEMAEVTVRHGDTPLSSAPHSRRRITLRDYDLNQMIDKRDARRMLHAGMLPQRYVQTAVQAANRKKDDRIIAAATGDAYSIDENDAASTVALPASQKVAVAASGLTLAKVLTAKEILDGNEVPEDEPRYAVVSAKQITNMLNTTEVKSADFNTIQALVQGQINDFLGFEWIRLERLGTDSNGDRQCLFYSQTAIGVAMGEEIETDIGPRRDKRNSLQIYVDMSIDATRIEDEKMVEVAALET